MTANSALALWIEMTPPAEVVFFGDLSERNVLEEAGFRLLDAPPLLPTPPSTPILIVGGDKRVVEDWVRSNCGLRHTQMVILCARSDEANADPLCWLRVVAGALDSSFRLATYEEVAQLAQEGEHFDAVIATYCRPRALGGG